MNKGTKRLLVVSTSMTPPSVFMRGSKTVYELQKQLVKLGYEVHILTHISDRQDKNYKKWINEQRKKYDIFYHVFEFSWLKKYVFIYQVVCSFYYIYEVFRLNKIYGFDIVHEYTSAPVLFWRAWFYKKFGVERVFSTLQTKNESLYASYLLSGGIKYLDGVICLSNGDVDRLGKMHPKYAGKVYWIGLGFVKPDMREEWVFKKPKGKVVVTYVGHLEKGKGVDDLIAALTGMGESERQKIYALFVVYGKEGGRAEPIDIITQALIGVVSYKIMSGMQPIGNVMKKSDVFVLPYRTLHGTLIYPATLIEAMWSGIAVVTSSVGGINEVVQNKVNGLLVEPGDISGMRRAIVGLIGNAHMRRKLGAAAREAIVGNPCFDQRNIASKLSELYLN